LSEHTEARQLDHIDAHPTEEPSSGVDLPGGRRLAAVVAFALIAGTVAVGDQILKRWIVSHYQVNEISPVVGDWFRIHFIHNAGGLFGLFQNTAIVFALITVAVVVVLVAIEAGSGWRSWLVTVTLGLLLGGALGNFIDRIRLGYVVDFADIGIGSNRFYIFNIADSAVTVAILLIFVLWFVAPHLGVRMPVEDEGTEGDRGADDAGSVKVR
jgi:signal peptidase II